MFALFLLFFVLAYLHGDNMERLLDKQAKRLAVLLLLEQERLGLNEYEMAIRCEISERQYKYMLKGEIGERGYYQDTLNKIFQNTNIKSNDIFDEYEKDD